LKEAASEIIENQCSLLGITGEQGALVGVVTEWDITKALSSGLKDDVSVNAIMTKKVISTRPDHTLIDVVQTLEQNEISAMPVVDGDHAVGLVSSDLLTRRSLLRLLQVSNQPPG
jgi:glutamate dehydrogenase (NAD(P)+)